MRTWGLGSILILIAIVLFVMSAIGVDLGRIGLVPLGLAFGFGGLLLGTRSPRI